MKIKVTLFLWISLMSLNSNGQNKEKENFEKFFEEFSFNNNFQMSRVKFPLVTIKYNNESNLDTSYIQSKDWKYNSFYFRTEWQARGQIYDSFKHELRDTDERVFEWKGIGNGVHDFYFFKRINGKWFLIKNIDYSN